MKKRLTLTAMAAVAFGIVIVLAACSSSPSTTTTKTTTPPPTTTTTPPPTTTTTPPPTTTTTPPPTTTTTPPAVTFGSLASSGQSQYSSTCAVCHGANGGGTDVCPVVMWGSGSTLGSYSGSTLFTDAQGMLTYMSQKMPLTSPGSLSSQQYNQLLAYILIQANKVSSSTAFDPSKLSSISIP